MAVFAASLGLIPGPPGGGNVHADSPEPGVPAGVPPVGTVPFELEGRIESIQPGPTPGTGIIRVLGVSVRIVLNTVIRTPVRPIPFDELLGPPLPGRTPSGFLNGIAVIAGESTSFGCVAAVVDVQPGENVLAGRVTRNAAGIVYILGTPVVLCTDSRMPGSAAREEGFAIVFETVPVGSFAAAEGYLDEFGVFRAHSVEAPGQIAGPPNQTAINRAAWSNGELDIRGHSTTPDGEIVFFDEETGERLGRADVAPADAAALGAFRFRTTVAVYPRRVRAVNSNGSFVICDVWR
ncbi:MAG: hypothetical protein HZB38_04900 [Planctomycetes bacterium]|nr:hypothetical protein [Planctomycetota bacterium]